MLNPEKYNYTVLLTNNTIKKNTLPITGSIFIDLKKAHDYLKQIDKNQSLSSNQKETIEHMLCFWKVLHVLFNNHITKEASFSLDILIRNKFADSVAPFSCGEDRIMKTSSDKIPKKGICSDDIQRMIAGQENKIKKTLEKLLIPITTRNKLMTGICVGSSLLGVSFIIGCIIPAFSITLGLAGIFGLFGLALVLTSLGGVMLHKSRSRQLDLIEGIPPISSLSIVSTPSRTRSLTPPKKGGNKKQKAKFY